MELRKISFKSEYKIPYNYKGFDLDIEFRCDFLIENILVLEIKSVEEVAPIHIAKLINYMNLLESPKGLMINFNVESLYYDCQTKYENKFSSSIIFFKLITYIRKT